MSKGTENLLEVVRNPSAAFVEQMTWIDPLGRISLTFVLKKKKNFLFTSISCKDIKDAFDWPFSGTGPYSGFFRNSWNNFCFEITRWHVFCLLSTVMSRVLLQISRQ